MRSYIRRAPEVRRDSRYVKVSVTFDGETATATFTRGDGIKNGYLEIVPNVVSTYRPRVKP